MASSNPKVNVVVGANAAGFNRTMGEVGGKVKELVGLSSMLKMSLAAAFGGAVIGEVIKNLVDFSNEVVKGAAALDVTTENFQALKIAAREAGTNMEYVEKIFQRIEKSASDALGGAADKMKALQLLGMTSEDAQLDKVTYLSKMMQGAGRLERGQAVEALRTLIGTRADPNKLMALQPTLAHFDEYKRRKEAGGAFANDADLEKISQLKDKMNALFDALKVKLIPVLAEVIVWVLKFVNSLVFTIAHLYRYTALKWDAQRGASNDTQMDVFFKQTAMEKRQNQKAEEKAEQDAKAARLLTQLDTNSHPTAEQPVQGKLGELPSNQYLKIGGLMGVDTNYRLQRLQVDLQRQANNYLQQIAVNTMIGSAMHGWGSNMIFGGAQN